MADLMDVLDKGLSAAGNFFSTQAANDAAQRTYQDQIALEQARVGAAERRTVLGFETTQATFKYLAIGGAILLGVVILARKKAV